MVKVCIEKQLLPVADMLTDIFRMRMADVCACENDRTQASGDCANSALFRMKKFRKPPMF